MRCTVVTFAAPRIDDPDVGNTEGEIVVNALLDPRHAIFARQYFDTDEGRLTQNRLLLFLAENYADVRDTEAGRRDLDAPFGHGLDVPKFAARPEVGDKGSL